MTMSDDHGLSALGIPVVNLYKLDFRFANVPQCGPEVFFRSVIVVAEVPSKQNQ